MRAEIRQWLTEGLTAVDPADLVADFVARDAPRPRNVIAMGKAAAGMCQGAGEVLGPISGICVTNAAAPVPDGVDLLIGDHPIPGEASFEAGRRILELVKQASGGCLVLVSGGGSSIVESPREGVSREYLQEANRRLLTGGVDIQKANLVRGHLSAIKSGGLARASDGPFPTYILSDVAGAGPEVVASGPTLPMRHAPEEARKILLEMGMEVPASVWEAMTIEPDERPVPEVTVIGDGHTAAEAVRRAADRAGHVARVLPGWLTGDADTTVARFLRDGPRGVTVAAGETHVEVRNGGRGGRNTHAALLAARRLAGSDAVFAAFATDGSDGASGSAGAMVDGDTMARGGDPSDYLEGWDSATYLEGTGDLLQTGPTGTNVADLWVHWRP